jgi:lipopolysaccharide biosynthesis glycosyltransferase
MSPEPDAPVVASLAFDNHAFRGATLTVQSAIHSHLGKKALHFHLFTKNLSPSQVTFLEGLSSNHPNVTIFRHSIDDSIFADCKSLHGSFMTYARILLPDLIATSRLIYLDSDLLITDDLESLWQSDLQGQPLGAASLSTVRWSNDHKFLTPQGISIDAPYFNAGVLLIDSARWQTERTGEKLISLAKIHGSNLPSVDQTLLNFSFHNLFTNLDPKWNQHLYANLPPTDVVPGILHFLGAPKPWDFWGMGLHMAVPLFQRTVHEKELLIPPLTLTEIINSPSKVLRSARSLFRLAQAHLR